MTPTFQEQQITLCAKCVSIYICWKLPHFWSIKTVLPLYHYSLSPYISHISSQLIGNTECKTLYNISNIWSVTQLIGNTVSNLLQTVSNIEKILKQNSINWQHCMESLTISNIWSRKIRLPRAPCIFSRTIKFQSTRKPRERIRKRKGERERELEKKGKERRGRK